MKTYFKYISVLAIVGLMASCVPQRKLEEEQAKRGNCEKELSTLKTNFQTCETKLDEATKSLADNLKRIEQLVKDTTSLGEDSRLFAGKYHKINEVNEQLLDKYNHLLSGNVADTKKLSGELQSTQEQLLKKQDELKTLETKLNEQKTNLDALTVELKKREARVAELEGVLKKKDDAVNELKKKLTDALFGFEGKGLTITQKNGKVYVSMEENLLWLK